LKNHDAPSLSIYSSTGVCQAFPLADFAEQTVTSVAKQIDEVRTAQLHAATWRDSGSICSLADAERHLGHIIRAGDCWLAFDATHVNDTGTGFRLLGCCANIDAAKHAVEQLVLRNHRGLISTLQ